MKKICVLTILFLALLLAGCTTAPGNGESDGTAPEGYPEVESLSLDAPEEAEQGPKTTGEVTNIVLYFADSNGKLAPEQRQIPKVPGLARKTIEELCKGPNNTDLFATIPAGTRLLDVNIRDGLCTVDFSRELVANHTGGSSGELLTVYSIVNTLTQFSTVERVNIIVEGQKLETLAGHLDLSVILEREQSILR